MNQSPSEQPCPNCKETIKECACLRNKCRICGAPVGNMTFTICDGCWENKYINKYENQDEFIDNIIQAYLWDIPVNSYAKIKSKFIIIKK